MGATPGSVRCSSIGGEPGEESADNPGSRLRVPRFRVSESPGADAIDVAARKGVPQCPPAGPRGGAIVSVQWASRRGDPEAEPDPEWVVYLFPGRQQQPDIPCGGLDRSERVAVVAPSQAPVPLADCQETMGVSLST